MTSRPPRSRGSQSLRDTIIELKCKKMSQDAVVDLSTYRHMKKRARERHILVVDQDEVTRNGMKRFLEGERFRVELAEDAITLSEAIEQGSLDMIFLDMDLPWVNGVELCQLIKGHRSLQGVPVILTGNEQDSGTIHQAFAAGCDEYLVKPFDAEKMTEVVRKVFGENS
ncbi:response regulator [Pseudobacteriovorax antillogorgiicola]|uniref:Response regulator receiver domain-containing protein n=1 Tax=Pseudobacteriovorax antillogorgiicola TaxID=1513793 RepID=A0A1Y6B2N2_9BACT|nr:response regulator [Pseudobacteriovorax antillogorgiicola]TCS59426.1 response regulator receiver domain-containing protein [Pseudobacteriovorax antillogorgiicola]SME88384.1 Response regulator receiver domain-containing protein [Pseudobacteriovorax antillogorgiicola]